MRIAVIARFLTEAPDAFHLYVAHLIKTLAENHFEHEITWFSDQPSAPGWAFLNFHPIVIGKPLTNTIRRFWWNNVSLPTALKKHGADLVLQTGITPVKNFGQRSLLLTNPVLDQPAGATLSKTFRDFRQVVLFSTLSTNAYKTPPGTAFSPLPVSIAPLPGYKPLDYDSKEVVKSYYASGCEFFLFDASAQDAKSSVINVLKAFTLFKVRQQTNLKLVIYGRPATSTLYDELKTYKFREGVRVVDGLPTAEHQRLIAAAYALVFPGNLFPSPVVQAMCSEVPVIAPATPLVTEITGDAILVADMNDPQSIADQMKLIYKDEDFRRRLVLKGIEQVSALNWHLEVEKLHDLISQAVSS